MKTSVTHVTVKDLIGVRIKTTKTYFAVSLKKFFACRLSGFGGFYVFHIIQELLKHFMCFVLCPMDYISENGWMHEIRLNQGYLCSKVFVLCYNVYLNVRNQIIPHDTVLYALLIDLAFPKIHLDVNFFAEFHLSLGFHGLLKIANRFIIL